MKKIIAILACAFLLAGCAENEKNVEQVTVNDLMPTIEKAFDAMYFIDGGDEIFYNENGEYVSYGGRNFYDVMNSFDEVFAEDSGIPEMFFSDLRCYKSGDKLLIENEKLANYAEADEDVFALKGEYESITICGGIGANPTFVSNSFEITEQSESALSLKNTVSYTEENERQQQVFIYEMVFEDGTWKFMNFERWY